MSPSRGGAEVAAAAASAEANGGPLGASASAAATEEAGMHARADPPQGLGRGRARWWLRWPMGVAALAVVAIVLALGLSLSSRSQAGPGPGGTDGGWQSQQADEPLVGLEPVKQQQQPQQPSSAVATVNAPVTAKTAAGAVAGQGQAAAAASTLNELAKQLLGEGGGNPGLGGGILEDEEEDEAEASFIAVEGCTPHNAGELHFLVERSTCPVITLVPGIFYNLTEYMVVRRPVLIVGRPLNPPTIDAHAAYRAFLVEAGGFLDLRHVIVYRGKPIEVIKPQLYYEVRGAVAYIRSGGTAFFTDCVMLLHEDTVSEFLITPTPQTTVRIVGGFLLLESGTLHVVGCHILVQRPGVLFREVYTVGGFILVVNGTLFLTGSTLTATFLFITVLGLGNFICVLGGNTIITGVVFTLNGGFVAGNGAGLLQFIGGGVATFTGSVSEGNLLFLSFFGAGMGQFTGGGVSILTGMIFSSVSVMNYGAGVGFNNGLGAGVMVKTGVTQSGAHSQSALAVLGVATFVGAGTVVYSETAWNRNTALAAFYGGGGSLYLGTGVATIVNSVSAGATATVIAAAAGGDHTLFAGWMNLINSWFFKWVVIAAYYGQGVDTCLVAGGAYLLNTGYSGIPPIVDANRGLYNIYVAGHGIKLNDSRAGVVATHKFYRVNNGTSKRQRRQLASPVSLRGLNLTGANSALRLLPTGPARLEMRRVSFRDFTPAAFKQAVQESATDGVPNQWPWRLKALVQEEEAAERRERREQRRAQAEAAAAVSPPLEQQPPQEQQQEQQEQVGEDEPLVPLYPGSPVLVPYAAPRPAEGPGANSRVYVASPLAGCRACGVRASSGAAATTAEAFAGKGAEGCDFSEACAAEAEDGEGDEDGYDSEVMWMVPPGSGRMPNTSLAVVDLVVSSSPSSSADPAPQQVLRALNRTIASLSLGPPRFHLRVLPASVPLPYDPPAEGGRLRRLVEEEDQAVAEAVDADEPCSRRVPFRAYLVSDKPQVIAALAKGLRQPAAAAAMTEALHEEQTAQGSVEACGLRATRAVQTFIPGLNSSALLQPPKGTAMAAVPTAGTGTGIARVLAAAGKARPVRTVLFGDDEDEEKEGLLGGSRALAAPGAAHSSPRHPTAALLLHGKVDEEEDGSRVVEARPGETYTLALGRFPSGRRLRVRLVSQTGRGALLHVLPSEPQGAEGRQGWALTIPATVPAGKYFLEVASHARDGFAYTQAFDVLAA